MPTSGPRAPLISPTCSCPCDGHWLVTGLLAAPPWPCPSATLRAFAGCSLCPAFLPCCCSPRRPQPPSLLEDSGPRGPGLALWASGDGQRLWSSDRMDVVMSLDTCATEHVGAHVSGVSPSSGQEAGRCREAWALGFVTERVQEGQMLDHLTTGKPLFIFDSGNKISNFLCMGNTTEEWC